MVERAESLNSASPDSPPPTSRFTESVPRIIASCFSLAAFSVAVLSGVAQDNPAAGVLVRAMISMVVCYPVGWGVGRLCQFVINNHIRVHEAANPAPDLGTDEVVMAATETDDEEVIRV